MSQSTLARLSPSLVLLLEQLTPSLPALSALARLHVVFSWLKELLACAILNPAALQSPPPSSSPLASSSSAPAASPTSGLPRPPPQPAFSPPPLTLADSPVKRALLASTSAASSLASSSSSSVSSLSSSPSSFAASPAVPSSVDVRLLCELLQLCYIESLARPCSKSATDVRCSVDGNEELNVPPSAASLSLIAFLSAHPHFASTSSFRSLLSEFVNQCGVVFLLYVADRLQCLPRALSFIGCHALPHVNGGCVSFLVTRGHCPLMMACSAGSHIFRCLPASQQLEMLIMQLLAPSSAIALSTLTVMSQLWEIVPSLDAHSLYRLCTLLDPSSHTVSPAAVDSHSRIVLCELFLYALCRLRQRAERRSVDEAAAAAAAAADGDDEELSFYSAASLHAALLQHRSSYRVWLILALLNDLQLHEAAATLYEAAEQWVDALEARLRLITQHRHVDTASQHYVDDGRGSASSAMLSLLQSHVARVTAGPEQARCLALFLRAWKQCELPAEELEAQLIQHMDDLAESLSILAFTSPPAIDAAQPLQPLQLEQSYMAAFFSPVVLLHLSRYRLQLLHQSREAAASVSLGSPAASPRMWHDLRQRLHGNVGRRQMATVRAVSEMTQLADYRYRQDSIVAFSCGHCQFAFDMNETSIPQLHSATHSQQQTAAITRHYERAQRDGSVVRLACPTCVAAALSGQQQTQLLTKRLPAMGDGLAGIGSAHRGLLSRAADERLLSGISASS